MIKSTARSLGIACVIILLVCTTAGAEGKTADTNKDGTPLLATPFVVCALTAPNPFRIEDKTHLVYELAITNFWKTNFFLEKVEVLDQKSNTPLLTLKGDEFQGLIYHVGKSSPKTDSREIKGGETVIVFMWVAVEDNGVPDTLRHNLTFREEDNPKIAVLERPTVEVNKQEPPVISPPLRGDGWAFLDGPANSRKLAQHRFAIMPVQGGLYDNQRYAVDWMKFGKNGMMHSGDISKNSSWYCYGEKIYAVADGIVTMGRGDLPENIPMTGKYAVPLTQETAAGNFIILDIGNERYALYAHLMPGSLRVKVGDKVRRGQVIALVGNSGHSEAPHLHFHITGPVDKFLFAAQGYPYKIDYFLKVGRLKVSDPASMSVDDFLNISWRPEPGQKGESHRYEMPATFAIVNL